MGKRCDERVNRRPVTHLSARLVALLGRVRNELTHPHPQSTHSARAALRPGATAASAMLLVAVLPAAPAAAATPAGMLASTGTETLPFIELGGSLLVVGVALAVVSRVWANRKDREG